MTLEQRQVVEAALHIAESPEMTPVLTRAVLTVAAQIVAAEGEGRPPSRGGASADEAPRLAALLRRFFRYMMSLTEDPTMQPLALSLHARPLRDAEESGEASSPPYCFAKKAWVGKQQIKRGFSIEDPIEVVGSVKPHDLAAPLTTQTTSVLRGEYKRAATLLSANLTEGGETAPGGLGARALLDEVLRSGTSPARRKDEGDGEYYTEKEFIEYYGREEGSAKWAAGSSAGAR